MDKENGPDGELYTWSTGTDHSENPEAQLARIDYERGGEYKPVEEV